MCVCATGALAAPAAPRLVQSADARTIVRGHAANLDWGRPLASGDFDGDGYDELVVAASESFGGGVSTVHIIRGGPGAHARGVVNLATAPADLVLIGASVDDNLGASLADGDVNGDGVDDLLVVASTGDFGGLQDRGIAYLLFGGAGFFDAPTRDMAVDASWDMRILGPVAGGDMGGSLLFGGFDAEGAAIGNLNGDIYGDMALGVHLADGADDGSGRVYVKFGGPFPSGFTLNLALSSGYDFVVWGAGELDELGTVVKTGDLTGDGIDELILPDEYASQGLFTSEGAVFVFRGRGAWPSLFNLGTSPADITLLGARDYDNLGQSAAVGDFNGDGITDLAAAAPGADAGAFNNQRGDGIVYGLLGGAQYQTATHLIDLATDTVDFTLIGEFEENLGTLVTAGDYNGDGVDDIAAAEWFAGPNINGAVEVLLGRDFAPGASFTAAVDTDIRILGAANDRISFSLATLNSNGDGLAEIAFGTPFNNANRGSAYLYTYVSADADFDGDIDLRDLAELQPCVGNVFTAPATAPCVLLDNTLDEQVDGADLDGLLAEWTGPQTDNE